MLLAACDSAPSARPSASASVEQQRPRFIQGELPVAAFVAKQVAGAPVPGKTLVYVGAPWCEPCQRFHRALEAGELDGQLGGVRFIEYDSDRAREALAADGYASRLIPLFAVPGADGRATTKRIEGSIKGEGAVSNIMPRLADLLARSTD